MCAYGLDVKGERCLEKKGGEWEWGPQTALSAAASKARQEVPGLCQCEWRITTEQEREHEQSYEPPLHKG